MDFDQIEMMPKLKFKQLVREKVKNHAFEYLIGKKLSRQKIKHIVHNDLNMAGYLCDNDLELTVKERQFLFQCRTYDIDVRANRTWKYDNIYCLSCNDNEKEDETQEHILSCNTLIGRNDQLTYIPEYNELFSIYVEDQIYTSRMIYENMRIRESVASVPNVN